MSTSTLVRRKTALIADSKGVRNAEELVAQGSAIRIAVADIFAELAELESQPQ